MSNIIVKPETIDNLWETAEKHWDVIFGKCTVLTVKLSNGFVLTESSACVDPENFDDKIGRECCEQRVRDKLWMLEGYCLQKQVKEQVNAMINENYHDFGWCLSMLQYGYRCRRRGWNGKGIFIALQKPDEHSKMTRPYIYIDTTGLCTDNPDAPKDRVPWLASQTDMLAEDWELAK